MMRRHVLLIVTLLSLACGTEPTSPSSAQQWSSFPPQAPPGPPRTMRGEVWDTTNLPISGAQVEVVAPTRGTVAVTDENGQFLMSWPFTGTVNRADVEGGVSLARIFHAGARRPEVSRVPRVRTGGH